MKSKAQKPAVVRPGQRKPFRKSTAEEVDRRVAAVETMLSRGFRSAQIHSACEKQFNVSWRQAEEYIARARKSILARLNKPKDEHRCDALGVYESIIQSADSRPSDRIRARQRIDELLGLDAPRRTELSGPEGEPIAVRNEPPELDDAEVDKLLATAFRKRGPYAQANRHNGNGNGNGNGSSFEG